MVNLNMKWHLSRVADSAPIFGATSVIEVAPKISPLIHFEHARDVNRQS